MDHGSPVDVIYLDFQKAFDKVPHQRLLIKLKSHEMGVHIVGPNMDTKLANRQKAKGKCGRRNISMDCSKQRGASRIGTGATTLITGPAYRRPTSAKSNTYRPPACGTH